MIAGVDEAGRGPLAGALFAAAVILDVNNPIEGLADSKKLNANQRERLFELIQEKALSWCVGRAEAKEIDQINILQATLLAMRRAVEGLHIMPTLVLVDGNTNPNLNFNTQTIIKGDATVPAISAASIVAKVLRDREMLRLDKEFPEYQFAKHKGYGTALHLQMLQQYGPCIIHRQSFAPVLLAAKTALS